MHDLICLNGCLPRKRWNFILNLSSIRRFPCGQVLHSLITNKFRIPKLAFCCKQQEECEGLCSILKTSEVYQGMSNILNKSHLHQWKTGRPWVQFCGNRKPPSLEVRGKRQLSANSSPVSGAEENQWSPQSHLLNLTVTERRKIGLHPHPLAGWSLITGASVWFPRLSSLHLFQSWLPTSLTRVWSLIAHSYAVE